MSMTKQERRANTHKQRTEAAHLEWREACAACSETLAMCGFGEQYEEAKRVEEAARKRWLSMADSKPAKRVSKYSAN